MIVVKTVTQFQPSAPPWQTNELGGPYDLYTEAAANARHVAGVRVYELLEHAFANAGMPVPEGLINVIAEIEFERHLWADAMQYYAESHKTDTQVVA